MNQAARAIRGLRLVALILCLLSLLSAPKAFAFIASEDQQFQVDIDEAKSRAHDFKRTLKRNADDDAALEAAGATAGEGRVREAKVKEREREAFVRERDARPSEEFAREQLEQEDDREKQREREQMDLNRRQYVHKRDRVRRVMERDAYIDENLEYGL